MDDAETVVQPNKGVRLQATKRRAAMLTEKQRGIFLTELAASCNISTAALAAGADRRSFYRARVSDAEFAADWAAALEVGYARLETALLRAAIAATDPDARAERVACDAPDIEVAPVDPEFALRVLQFYRTGRHKAPGDMRPGRSDIEGARARLEKKMRALRLIDADGNPVAELRPIAADARPALAAPDDTAPDHGAR